jgi:hypothetical protein
MKAYRQGDVLLIAVSQDDVPTNTKEIRRDHGKAILAHGEVTGHHHAILDPDAELVGVPGDGQKLVTADQAASLYLLVHGTSPVALTHQEHATITIDPGTYRVVRQREYTPEQIRRVVD